MLQYYKYFYRLKVINLIIYNIRHFNETSFTLLKRYAFYNIHSISLKAVAVTFLFKKFIQANTINDERNVCRKIGFHITWIRNLRVTIPKGVAELFPGGRHVYF